MVEVLNIKTLVWSAVASLPHPYTRASVAICGDQLYMLGGEHNRGEMSLSVMMCSLTELLRSQEGTPSVWQRLTDAPVYYSTCAAVHGELLTVGGKDTKQKSVSTVHKYSPFTDSWEVISYMPTARSNCLVALLSTDELMVIGGESHLYETDTTTLVETAEL